MKKIPSLFKRDFNGDPSRVTTEIEPSCAWALTEGRPTRKWDGTATMVRAGHLFKRYDAKHGKVAPAGFEPCQEADPVTGHRPGWLPVGNGPEDKWFLAAFESSPMMADGTYELCGPHFQTNPERFEVDTFVPHGARVLEHPFLTPPRSFETIKAFLVETKIEGIVFWRDNGEMTKIKRCDFGLEWAPKVPRSRR
jgi:hypothetical protein